MERAHETIEEHAPHSDRGARRVAVLVSVLAAVLAMSEIGGKAAQNAYLSHHIALSNNWAFYQAKNQRAIIRTSEVDVLASLPNAADPAIQARIKEAQAYIARMRDDPEGGEGMKQLAATAQQQEAERDEAMHRYHNFEYAVGALEIAIVLASISVVTRMRPLTIAAAVIGALASAGSLGIATNLF
jgi:cytochrome bd-type quinol oxidase subunit 1